MSLTQHKPLSLKLKLCASTLLLISPMINLTACSNNNNVNFAPLTYDYLTPIFFNVSQVSTQNLTVDSQYPRDVSNLCPTLPATALENMATNRFKARGTNGHAIFVINRASLQEDRHNGIYGQMHVTLDIYNDSDAKVATVQASVNHTYDGENAKGDANSKANLYDITQKMMQDMNVELEYQIRQHLQSWLVDATGTPIVGQIKAQDLNSQNGTAAPTSLAPVPASTTAPVATKAPASDEDLSAIFPAGVPGGTKQAPSTIAPATTAKKVGILGTIPQSAVPSGY